MAAKRKKSHGKISAARAARRYFVEARKRELASCNRCGVNEFVTDRAQTVVTWEVPDDCTVTPKSRLVARGFQEADNDSLDTANPTVDPGMWGVIVAMTAVYGWVPYCFNLCTAFLQGPRITRDVFLFSLLEIGEPGMVMKLNKSIYGLVDGPLQCSEALNGNIVPIGGVWLPYDKCAWMWYAEDDSLLTMLCAHVEYLPSDPFCTPLSVAVEQRLNPVEQHVAVQPPSCTRLNAVEQFNWPIAPIGGACSRDHAFNSG